MDLKSVSTGPTHRFGGLRNVLVCIYSGSPEVRALHDRLPWIESAIAEYGAVGLFVVVDARANGILPDRAFRETSRQQAERYEGRILFSATVLEGDAVRHAVVRTFLRGLAAVAGHDIPVRFFDVVPPAARWAEALARGLGGPSALEIESAVKALRP